MVYRLKSAGGTVANAKDGNIHHAIELLKDLNSSLKGELALEEPTREYFIECLSSLLDAISEDLTDQQMQTLTARSLNLVKKKGRKKYTSVAVEFVDSFQIHNLKVENPNMNIHEVVMLYMSTNKRYSRQYRDAKTDSLAKKYSLYKKKFGWEDSQMAIWSTPE